MKYVLQIANVIKEQIVNIEHIGLTQEQKSLIISCYHLGIFSNGGGSNSRNR